MGTMIETLELTQNEYIGGVGMAERGYSVAEVAEMFGVSRATIHNWMSPGKDNRFPNAYQLGNGRTSATVIPPEDIERVRDEEIARLKAEIAKLKAIKVER